MLWFWNETIRNIELFIILKIGNWPTKSAGGIKGGDHTLFQNKIFGWTPLDLSPTFIGQFTFFKMVQLNNKDMVSHQNYAVFKDKKKGALTCPILLLPARLSSRPPPRTTSDEGAEGRIELFRGSRKSLAPHLGARRGGAVMRSELRKENKRG